MNPYNYFTNPGIRELFCYDASEEQICKLTGLEGEHTKPLLTKDQFEVSMKILRDLNRYERKRRIAARIIAAQKKELCDMAMNFECVVDAYNTMSKENDEMNEEIADLKARLADEQETVYEQNDTIKKYEGRIEGLGWAFEKVIKKD